MTAPAYQADGSGITREAFYAIACDPRRSAVVEACAGAGKTWMLVSRIVRALLDGAQPQEILAITFTRKAAGEMRERLAEWLREFASPQWTPEQRIHELVIRGVEPKQAVQLQDQLAHLHDRVLVSGRGVEVRTFHSWFTQLLRAAPMALLNELGLQPGMEVVEDMGEHRSAVFRRFHARVLADALLHGDYSAMVNSRGSHQVNAWLDAALDKRVELELADEAGVLEPSVPPVVSAGHPADELLAAASKQRLQALAGKLGVAQGAVTRKAAPKVIDALLLFDSHAMFKALWKSLFTQEDTPRKLGAVDDLDAVCTELQALAARIHQHESHIEHGCLVRLSRVLLAEFADYKRVRRLADMADLERCALALLRDASLSAWVQERLDVRVRHLLIDEFQDTSPLQWHALHSWLSAYAGAGGGHSGHAPPGVFIVGDPKQSIYRFRRAEPRVFEAARDFVVDGLQGTWLACDHTRRNAAQVLAAVNAVFSTAEQAGEYPGFRVHTTEVGTVAGASVKALPPVLRDPTVRKRSGGENEDDLPIWRDSLATPRRSPEQRRREQEAQWVARAISDLVRGGRAMPGEIFVLSRKRESLRLVAEALQAAHLPFAASEKFALMDVPEVRDLVMVLDALASAGHRLSLAHALRSPLFDASDDDLMALFQLAGDAGDWWAALTAHEHAERPALQRAAVLMSAWQSAAFRLPPHDLLDRIVHEGSYRERVAAVVPPERRRAALEAVDALLAQALTLDGARYATPYNFVRALKRRAVLVPAPAQPDAVQLLTVHGAKGLEAKVVFVMDARPERNNANGPTLLIDWPVESASPVRCAFIYSEHRCPPSLAELMVGELAAREREELNGLYVAMTRAREQLVFSATVPISKAFSWWDRVEQQVQPWEPAPLATAAHAAAAHAIELPVLPQLFQPAGQRAATPLLAERETVTSRLGQAVHRVLEWMAQAGVSSAPPEERLESCARAAAAEFTASPSEVAQIAKRIWHNPQAQRFFTQVEWSGNEVAVPHAGEVLRIDRLVALAGGQGRTWWVLDYKLALRPEEDLGYRAQMQRYREAVMALQPNDEVRCALINGAGDVVEVT